MRLLWNFGKVINCKNIEINSGDKKLVCDCTEAEIDLAITKYGAKILEGTLSKVAI